MMQGLSITRGATDVPLSETTIGGASREAGRRWGDRSASASRHQGIRWTWAESDAEADRIATGSLDSGVRKGDRVGIWAPNCAEWAVIQFASARIGAVSVTINPAYRVSEVEYASNKVGCTVSVTAARFKTSDYVGMSRESGAEKSPSSQQIVVSGEERHEGFMPWADSRAEPDPARSAGVDATLDPNDAINIPFTSGTTGFPKGATLTHRNISNNGYCPERTIRSTPDDRICIPVPSYHCFGMVSGNSAASTSGAAMVYPSEAYDPRSASEAVQAEGCTALYGVPTMFITISNQPDLDAYDVSTSRTGIMAGSPCPVTTMRQVMERSNMREVTIGYGMTETSPSTTQTATDDPIEERVATVGRVHP
ncbi:hypothetical protein OY671_007794, partial [Metschnikowia pulcherrima]